MYFGKTDILFAKIAPKLNTSFCSDLFSGLKHGDVCVAVKDLFINFIKTNYPDTDIVVGLEARGFLFSFLIAAELGMGCVPIRKKGKLPGDTHEIQYSLDYGCVSIEII